MTPVEKAVIATSIIAALALGLTPLNKIGVALASIIVAAALFVIWGNIL